MPETANSIRSINHDNSSASYTWRPRSVGSEGSTHSMTAYSGPMYCGRAWQEVKANGGSAGVDGVSLEEVERQGVASFLEVIAADLKAGRYQPQAVLRVYIPKPDGRQRPLGIPTVRDRIVQQACRIVIEPVFEANFRICKAISQETGRNKTLLAQETVITTLNRIMIGWVNYFCLGPVSHAYRAVERHARKRLRQWLCAKHQLRWPATKQYPAGAAMHQVLGPRLAYRSDQQLSVGETVTLSPRAGCARCACPVR